MVNTGGYDLLIEFRPEVLGEVLSHVLDDPVTTLLQSTLFLPRQIAYPPPPETSKVQFWWEQPTYQVEDDSSGVVTVAVPVHGGVQVQQSIFSFEGEVRASRALRLVIDASGTPYLRLDEPDLTSLDLWHLTFSYAGRPQTPHAVLPGASGYLLGACLILFRTLAQLPCSYMIEAPRLTLSPPRGDSTALDTSSPNEQALVTGTSPQGALYPRRALSGGVHFLKAQPSAVALGLSLTGSAPDPSDLTVMLPEPSSPHGVERILPAGFRHASLNTTVTLTTAGINYLLDQALGLGLLAGDDGTPGSAGGRWRWEALHTQLREDVVSLSGSLTTDQTVSMEADLTCALDEEGHLSTRTLALRADGASVPPDAPLALTVAGSWQALMLRLLRAASNSAESASQRDADVLVQRFIVPATQVRLDCPARLLLVHDGALTLGYVVPQSRASLLGTVVDKIS